MTDNTTTTTPPPTARITFRRLQPDDTSLLHQLNHDPEVMTYIDHEPPSEEEVAQEVAEIVAGYARYPRFGRWIASCRETGEYMGWFALSVRAETRASDCVGDGGLEVELGYRLRRRFWGHGFATEGSQALVEYGFARDGRVQRVFGETMFVNGGSRRVMEKSGLRHVRTFPVEFEDPLPGTEKGEVEYAVRREEWERRGMKYDE